jgi:hypothetical protein
LAIAPFDDSFAIARLARPRRDTLQLAAGSFILGMIEKRLTYLTNLPNFC